MHHLLALLLSNMLRFGKSLGRGKVFLEGSNYLESEIAIRRL